VVIGKSIGKKVSGFVEHLYDGQSLWLSPSEAEDLLRVNVLGRLAALKTLAAVPTQIIAFREHQEKPEQNQRLFMLSLAYLKAHISTASQIVRISLG
jgi:hypothetical protein